MYNLCALKSGCFHFKPEERLMYLKTCLLFSTASASVISDTKTETVVTIPFTADDTKMVTAIG